MKMRSSAALIFAAIGMLGVSTTGFPNNTPDAVVSSAPGTGAVAPKNWTVESQSRQTYTVRKGDSLYSIAKAFKTSPDELKALNGLSGDRILAGQNLTVPGAPADGDLPEAAQTASLDYTVIAGDSLYGIARAYGTTVNALEKANGLQSSRLQIGQILRIPVRQSAVGAVPPAVNIQKQASAEAPVATEVLERGEPDPTPAAEEVKPDGAELPLRERLVAAGLKMLGVRYRFSGTSEKTGLDCSALVGNLFSKFDITLPRSSREQYMQGEKVDRENLEAGDLVFFSSGGKTPTHVGIYLGNNQFLHAARKAGQVIVSDLNKIWYNTRYIGARRIKDLWWADPENAPEIANK